MLGAWGLGCSPWSESPRRLEASQLVCTSSLCHAHRHLGKWVLPRSKPRCPPLFRGWSNSTCPAELMTEGNIQGLDHPESLTNANASPSSSRSWTPPSALHLGLAVPLWLGPPAHPGIAVRWRPREDTDRPWGHQGAVRSCEGPVPGSWHLFPPTALPHSHFWGARPGRQGASGRPFRLGLVLHLAQEQSLQYWICSYRAESSILCPNSPPVRLLFSSSLDSAADSLSDGDESPEGGQGPKSSPLLPVLPRRAGCLALDLGPHTWLG